MISRNAYIVIRCSTTMADYRSKLGKLYTEEKELVERIDKEWLTTAQEKDVRKKLERVRSWITIYKRMIEEGK